jgi:hypothetical protein
MSRTSCATPGSRASRRPSDAIIAVIVASLIAMMAPPAAATMTQTGACDSYVNVLHGSVAGTGDVVLLPADGYSVSSDRTHVGCLDGVAGIDIDLELVRGLPGSPDALVVETSDGDSSQEGIRSFQGEGDFHWRVTSDDGVGDFTLGWKFAVPALRSPACDESNYAHQETGSLAVAGDTVELPAGGYVTSGYVRHEACLEGQGNVDLSLARIEKDGSRTILAAGRPGSGAYGGDAEYYEKTWHTDAPGRYVWIVTRSEGSGSFWLNYGTSVLESVAGCSHLEDTTEGTIDGPGDTVAIDILPNLIEAGAHITVCKAHVSGTQMQVRLERRDPTDGSYDTVATDGTIIEHDAAGGSYRAVIEGISGAGDFRLGVDAPPNTSIVSGPPATTTDTHAWVSFAATEDVPGYRCAIDSGDDYYFCGSNQVYNDLPLGMHELRVWAVDDGGNVDPTPAVMKWEIIEPAREPAPPGSQVFDDVTTDNIFDRDIGRLYASGVTRGCGSNTFCPDSYVTRGQMAAFLVRALNLPASNITFQDTTGHLFERNIAALAAAGITRGCGSNTFCPDSYVTREQMAAFLARSGLLD